MNGEVIGDVHKFISSHQAMCGQELFLQGLIGANTAFTWVKKSDLFSLLLMISVYQYISKPLLVDYLQ